MGYFPSLPQGPNNGGATLASDGTDGPFVGGGGGGIGRIRILSETGVVDFSDAVLSPTPNTQNGVDDLLLVQGQAEIK